MVLHIPATCALYVIGDSHCRTFQYIEGCDVRWLSPVTMHCVGRDGLDLTDPASYSAACRGQEIPENSIVIFTFREIEMRCPIGKQSDLQEIPVEEVIQQLASNYITAILNAKSPYRDLLCIVYAVIPPSDQAFNPGYPRYGPIEDRIPLHKNSMRNYPFSVTTTIFLF